MNILVVAATQMEIAPFQLTNKTMDILITGVGVAPTIYHLTKKLSATKYDLVIQAGIAGSFIKELIMGEVVMVEKDTFADAAIIENEKIITLFEAGLSKNEPPFENGWLYNNHSKFSNSLLKRVTSITINTISDSARQKARYLEKFSPDIESMEGAGFHYVCLYEQVPFLQLRSISNEVGIRDKGQWQIKDAIYNLCDELEKLVTTLN